MSSKKKTERPSSPPLGWVRIVAGDKPPYKYDLTVRIGDGSPNPKHDTGWEREKKPRDRSLTHWAGNDGLEIEFPILFDHFVSNDGVTCEAEIRQLEKMSGVERGLGEPPTIAFNSGGVIPHDEHDVSDVDWVIATVEWGDSMRNRSGNRVRQACTLTLWEYVTDTVLQDESSAAKNRKTKAKPTKGKKKQGAKHEKHRVQLGETLSTIARDELGDAARWREIANKNKRKKTGRARRDPKDVTIGETLKMP